MVSVTDSTRNAVWQEMLDTARLVRYYDVMASRQQRRYHSIRLVLLASATTGIAAAMEVLPELFRVGSGAAVGVLVAWDFLADYANKAATLGSVRRDCNEVEVELAALWGEIQAGSIDEADARRRLTRATDRAGSAHIPTNDRLNAKCEEAAFKAMRDQYAEG